MRSPSRGVLLAALALSLPLAAFAVSATSPLDPTDEEALVNKKKGLCLDPAGDSAASRAVVALAACDGKPDQRWRFVSVGDDKYEIHNAKSDLCLDVQGYDANEKDPVILYACDKHSDQYWTKNSDGTIRNTSGVILDMSGGFAMSYAKCLDIKGHDADIGDAAQIYRCNGESYQSWSQSATGTKTTASGSGSSTQLCGSTSGPCVQGSWVASGSTYTGSGKLTVAQLPTASASLSLDAQKVTASVGSDFVVAGTAGLNATLPGPVAVSLPMGELELGYGAGVKKAVGGALDIGGESYGLQPSAVYAHAKTDFTGSVDIAGLSASFPVPGTKQEEFLVGLEDDGPSLYFSGDCNVVLPTIATISSCTVGWFGTRPLTHTLAVSILDPTQPLPAIGSSFSKVSTTIDAAILLGGDVTFDDIPVLGFSGMIALDPDSTTASSTSLSNLSKARAGLEGSTAINVGPFSMKLADSSLVYDAQRKQVDLAADIPVLDPFTAIGATFGAKFSGKAYAAGRFGATSNQLVFDFSKAKMFDFDLDKFQGQVDFQKRTMAVAGKIEIGKGTWTSLTGTFGGADQLSLTGGAGMKLDGHTLAGSSVTVSTSGVRLQGTVDLLGKSWAFDETMKTPRTIKSHMTEKSVSIPTVGGVTLELWAQYDVGGALGVKAQFEQSVGPFSTSQVWDVDTDGQIDLSAYLPGVKVKVL